MKPYLQQLIDSIGMGRAGRRGRVPAVLMRGRPVLNGRRCAFVSVQDGQLPRFGTSSGTSFSTNPVTAPCAMSIIVFIQRWPILLCQSYSLIASDPSPVLKATRVFAFVLRAVALSSSSGTKSTLFATKRFGSACKQTSLSHSSACRKGTREVTS